MSAKLQKEKFDTINKLLGDDYVLIHLDSTGKGVDLPKHIMNNPTVTLKLSKLFRGAIAVSEDKVESELLFGTEYYTCIVPLDAIWGATSSQGNNVIWPESAPKEILTQLTTKALDGTLKSGSKSPSKPAASASKAKSASKPAKKASHLRRIK